MSRTRRVAAYTMLWRAVVGGLRPGSPGLLARARSLPRLVRAAVRGHYRGLGLGRLAMMAAAVAYVVSPIDLVPEAAFLVLGLVDDAAIAAWLAGSLLVETERFLAWEQGSRPPAAQPDVIRGEVVRS